MALPIGFAAKAPTSVIVRDCGRERCSILQSPSDTGFCVWATHFALDSARLIATIDYQRVLAEFATKPIVDAFRAATPATVPQ